MNYYNLEDPFVSTSVNKDLPLLFAPLFQSLKRYTNHFLSFINQMCQILCLYTTNSSRHLAALFQEKNNLILLMKSLTTVLCVQASKPLCEDPSREKTEQHIKEQWTLNLSTKRSSSSQKSSAHQVLTEEHSRPGVESIHLSATS